MNTPHNSARRGFLRSACKHCMGLGAVLGLPALAQDAAPGDAAMVPPRFKRPALDTDEGGLWSMMDREEVRIRRRSAVGLLIDHAGGERNRDELVLRRIPLQTQKMAPPKGGWRGWRAHRCAAEEHDTAAAASRPRSRAGPCKL